MQEFDEAIYRAYHQAMRMTRPPSLPVDATPTPEPPRDHPVPRHERPGVWWDKTRQQYAIRGARRFPATNAGLAAAMAAIGSTPRPPTPPTRHGYWQDYHARRQSHDPAYRARKAAAAREAK